MKIIGADHPGDYGIKIGNKTATVISHQGGMNPYYQEGSSFSDRSNLGAIRKAAKHCGWDAEKWVKLYEED